MIGAQTRGAVPDDVVNAGGRVAADVQRHRSAGVRVRRRRRAVPRSLVAVNVERRRRRDAVERRVEWPARIARISRAASAAASPVSGSLGRDVDRHRLERRFVARKRQRPRAVGRIGAQARAVACASAPASMTTAPPRRKRRPSRHDAAGLNEAADRFSRTKRIVDQRRKQAPSRRPSPRTVARRIRRRIGLLRPLPPAGVEIQRSRSRRRARSIRASAAAASANPGCAAMPNPPSRRTSSTTSRGSPPSGYGAGGMSIAM